MDKTKNIQLAAFFNQLYKVDTIEELSELAGQMNSVFGQTIIAEDSIKNIESGGNADEFLIDLVRKLEGMVKGEDQSAFYDSVDLNLLEYFENDEEKKRILDERYAEKYLGEDDFGFEEENPKYTSNKMYFPNIIKSIKDDKIKFEVLSKHRELLVDTFKDSQYPIVTINSIKDEEKRVELVELYRPLLEKEKPETALDMQIGVMQDFKDGKYRDLILSQMYPRYDLSNKDSRMSLYESIDDYPLKIEVAKGFDEETKYEIYRKLAYYSLKSELARSMTDEKKLQVLEEDFLDKLEYHSQRDYLIQSLDTNILDELGKDPEKLEKFTVLKKYRQMKEFMQDGKLEEEQKYSSFGLPSEMTIGMEVESESPYMALFKDNADVGRWNMKPDGSLGRNYGIEVVSPILRDDSQSINEVYQVNRTMQKYMFAPNENCGGHIHIGADYLKSADEFRELLEIYGNAEELLYIISNRPGEIPRRGVEDYATAFSGKILTSGLERASDDEFIDKAKEAQSTRYSGLNLLNINNGKNTIEFRLANGSVDPDIWIENAKLFGKIVQMSHEIVGLRDKESKGEVLTPEEEQKLKFDETIKHDIPRDEKMEALMGLLFDDPKDKEVFNNRYQANKELWDKQNYALIFSEVHLFGKDAYAKIYNSTELEPGFIDAMRMSNDLEQAKTDEIVKTEERR